MVDQKCYKKFIKSCMFICLILFFGGCSTGKKVYSDLSVKQIGRCKIAFLGLKSAIPEGESSDRFHNPLSDTMISAEQVSKVVSDILSDKLFFLIQDARNYEMVNMKGYQISGYNSSKPLDINAIKDIVEKVSADIVITGYVYRMHEREGGKYSAASPASAAFAIYFIDIKNGSIIWKGSYDKTQKSLSENLLDFKSFLKFKGKWVDVNSLADIGLKELVDDMPLKN